MSAGQQAILHASVQIYATGTTGNGSAATPLLSKPVKTDDAGNFTMSGVRPCPSATSEVYLVSTGGSPAQSRTENPDAMLMTLLGSCSTLTSFTSIHLNEVTTVASVYALAPYMSGPSAIGSSAGDAQVLADAVNMASELANLDAGTSPGLVPAGEAAPTDKLNTLANLINSCVDSRGGSAGDGSSCGNLFLYAGESTISPSRDTLSAVLAIAKAPAPTSPLRVLHVLEATLGGTLRYMENIATCLGETELCLGFAYATARADSRLEPLLTQLDRSGWNLYPVPMRREINFAGELESIRKLRRVLQEFRPDVVHCHSSKAGVLGRVASLLVRPSPAVVYSPHALAIPLGRQYLYIERLLCKLAGRFIAVSNSEAEDIVHYELATPDRVSIAYPLIDCDYFTPRAGRVASSRVKGPFTVVGVGRLTAQKDPLRFITIVRKLQETMPDVRGVWIGDGELRQEFEQSAANGSGSFQLVPWQRDIRPFLSAADVLLSTSRYESIGYMVAEALALQVPVVASRISGTSDILIDEYADNMYELDDADRAADLLKRVLQDTGRARGWAASAREMIRRRFNLDSMREALLDAYSRTSGIDIQRGMRPRAKSAQEVDCRWAS